MTATRRPLAVGLGFALLLTALLAAAAAWTAPTRGAVRTYTALISAANRGDLDDAARLCSAAYLRSHPLRAASGGGLVGLPRGLHVRFQVWRDGPHVLLCPTNRVGPVYRFVDEAGDWKFDGPAGLLRGRGQLIPVGDGGVEISEDDESGL